MINNLMLLPARGRRVRGEVRASYAVLYLPFMGMTRAASSLDAKQ